MIEIEQGSVAAMTAEGRTSEISTTDSTVVGLVLDNSGTDDVYVQVQYVLSDGQQHVEVVRASAQSQQWVSWNVGPLAAGDYGCTVTVTSESDGGPIGEGVTYFAVTGGYQHDPDDYRLEIGEIRMQTEGGNIVHAEDQAFATERVYYNALVHNTSNQFLGPVEVHFLVDGDAVGWGGMSYSGVAGGDSFWAQGYTDPLPVGTHTLSIRVESSDPGLFVGDEQAQTLTVLPPRSRGSVAEGDEADLSGWAARELNLYIKDYLGQAVDGNIYVEINGGGRRVAKRGVIEQGVVHIDGTIHAPMHEGSFALTVDARDGRRLTGGGIFEDGDHAITQVYVEGKRKEKHTFTSEEHWEGMIGTTVSGGFELGVPGVKLFSGGIEVRGEYRWGETIIQGREYEVWIASGILEDEEKESAAQR